jgi:hypothetical protein
MHYSDARLINNSPFECMAAVVALRLPLQYSHKMAPEIRSGGW